ncbi:hypothetical protein MTR_0019s0150 [Medicago truncatula]|uniref:Putative plant transposon protein domain-containing protein n=1 Tax=Medicago truncatula TaxID=3880 RepID=A0A072TIZ1_MEDTR|nr:hypothetical protein MTR_0019s0150 [Medicago truncatula]
MARTKGNHTDFSLSPSPSPERSPSPPPPPSPRNPNSDPFSCSPPKSQTNSAPLKTYSRIVRPRMAKSSETLKKPVRKSTRLSAKRKRGDVMFVDLDSDEDRPLKNLKKSPTDSEKNAERIEKIKKDFKDAVQKRKLLKECSSPQSKNKKSLNEGSASEIKHMRIPLHDPSLDRNFKKWVARPIGVGRVYNFEKLLKEGVELLKFVKPLGWTNFFQIKETHYPEVVRNFYFMAETFPKEDLIVSKIQDKVIKLSAERLAVILDIPQKGPKCYGRTGYANAVVSRFDIIREMFVKYESDDDLISANLKKEYKLLHNMCQFSITPRKGSKHKVSETDILVMYHMFHSIDINLPVIIIRHMIHATTLKKTKSCVPYGMVLTRVFKNFNINLDKEKFDTVCSEFLPKNIAHMKKTPPIEIPQPSNTPDEAETSMKGNRVDKGKAPMDELLDAILEETCEGNPIPSTVMPTTQVSEKFNQASNSVLDLNSPFLSHIPGNTWFEQAEKAFPSAAHGEPTVVSPLFSHQHGSSPSIFGSSFLETLLRTSSGSGSFSAPVKSYFGNMFSDQSLPSLPSHFGTFESSGQYGPPPAPPNTPDASAGSRNVPPPPHLTMADLTAALRPILEKLDLVYNLQSFMVLDWTFIHASKSFNNNQNHIQNP